MSPTIRATRSSASCAGRGSGSRRRGLTAGRGARLTVAADNSRPGRATWCSPRLCGDRVKTQAYRRRPST
ncbi:CGNR zinc finger domain-containing protein [Streptomyces sp. PRKS01-29]|nr:CGNR zinc finger domain-containing protein [Streptomyces sabulosicollis]